MLQNRLFSAIEASSVKLVAAEWLLINITMSIEAERYVCRLFKGLKLRSGLGPGEIVMRDRRPWRVLGNGTRNVPS